MYALIESVRRWVTPTKTAMVSDSSPSSAGTGTQAGGSTLPLGGTDSVPTPPFGVPADTPPGQVYEVLRADVAKRLRNVCSDWSEEDFDAIVHKVTQTAIKHLPEFSQASASTDGRRALPG